MGKEFHNNVPKPPESGYYAPPADVKREFSKRLSAKLREKSMTQSELARRVSVVLPKGQGLGRDLVSNYVRGRHVPRPATLAAIAKVLDCQPDDLLPPGSVPTTDVYAAPKAEMKVLESGAVWLQLNVVLPFDEALKIMALANTKS